MTRGHEAWFEAAEFALGLVFLVEYLARLWCAGEIAAYRGWLGRLRYLLRPAALLDLAAIVSTLVPLVGVNAMPLRTVRLFRILRLAKLGRMSRAMHHLGQAIVSRRDELIVTGTLALGVLILAATVLYWIEGEVQPEKFGSIPRAMWWATVALMTIGYGDVAPVTPAGKIASGIVALLGIGLIAIPTGIIAAAFSDAVQRDRQYREKD